MARLPAVVISIAAGVLLPSCLESIPPTANSSAPTAAFEAAPSKLGVPAESVVQVADDYYAAKTTNGRLELTILPANENPRILATADTAPLASGVAGGSLHWVACPNKAGSVAYLYGRSTAPGPLRTAGLSVVGISYHDGVFLFVFDALPATVWKVEDGRGDSMFGGAAMSTRQMTSSGTLQPGGCIQL